MQSFDLPVASPVCAVQLSDLCPHRLAVLNQQNDLFLYDFQKQSILSVFRLCHEYAQGRCLILFVEPYIAIAQRYGLNAHVVDTRTGQSWDFVREDYHCDSSTFSIGLARQPNGQMLLLHQTQWNRLDITDLSNGTLLTQRLINAQDKVNYLDYFHSQLVIAPDGQSFLSNGWHWAPVDNIRAGFIDAFLSNYELSTCGLDYANGYNWDRPAVFIDNQTFVIAVDDPDADMLDAQELAQWPVHRLRFYRMNGPRDAHGHLQHIKTLNGDWFEPNSYGEVSGSLYYAARTGLLIVRSPKGFYAITLEGETVAQLLLPGSAIWDFNRDHEVFYGLAGNTLNVALLSDLLNL